MRHPHRDPNGMAAGFATRVAGMAHAADELVPQEEIEAAVPAGLL